jgi:hypothetical protein
MMATKDITCNFIGEFKVGDNITRNAASLCKLGETNEGEAFNKLIVVQAGSIIEAGYSRSLLICLQYARRPHSENRVNRIPPVGTWVLINKTWY